MAEFPCLKSREFCLVYIKTIKKAVSATFSRHTNDYRVVSDWVYWERTPPLRNVDVPAFESIAVKSGFPFGFHSQEITHIETQFQQGNGTVSVTANGFYFTLMYQKEPHSD